MPHSDMPPSDDLEASEAEYRRLRESIKSGKSQKKNVLDNMMDTIDWYKEEFYKRAIELHNDERLRKFAPDISDIFYNGGYQLSESGRDADYILYYHRTGFRAYSRNSRGYRQFDVEESRLIMRGYDKEMLDIFPEVTIESIESALEKSLKQHKLYKAAETAKKKKEDKI